MNVPWLPTTTVPSNCSARVIRGGGIIGRLSRKFCSVRTGMPSARANGSTVQVALRYGLDAGWASAPPTQRRAVRPEPYLPQSTASGNRRAAWLRHDEQGLPRIALNEYLVVGASPQMGSTFNAC